MHTINRPKKTEILNEKGDRGGSSLCLRRLLSLADALGPAAAFPFPVAFPLAAAALGVFFLVSAAAAVASSSEVSMARSDRVGQGIR
jgi:hypothetical protein